MRRCLAVVAVRGETRALFRRISGMYYTINWDGDTVSMLDQRKLPAEETYQRCATYQEVAAAIRDMVIRGAPAIGVAAAMGIALGAQQLARESDGSLAAKLEPVLSEIAAARPTAVNLFWAVERMRQLISANAALPARELAAVLRAESQRVLEEDIATNKRMGAHGAPLFDDGDVILTHCNAGALATGGFGTALGVIRAAAGQGKRIRVFADETRPYLQGARLTAWELHQDGIPVTLITDNMAGYLMSTGVITKAIVGADRIAANGDVANKIGTYTVAVVAARHRIPLFVAAPRSTIDMATASGAGIPIEERAASEVTHFGGTLVAPTGISVRNPAFDVTPAELVAAIITEAGVVRAPYAESLRKLMAEP